MNAIIRIALLAALAIGALLPVAHAQPAANQFLVRSGTCASSTWTDFTTGDQAKDLSVWCHSQATKKNLKPPKYQTLTEDNVCLLRCLVRAKFVAGTGGINVDPWPSQKGCAAFTRDVTGLAGGSVVYAASAKRDTSGTGNHCEINGPSKDDLMGVFDDNHFDCSNFVCPP